MEFELPTAEMLDNAMASQVWNKVQTDITNADVGSLRVVLDWTAELAGTQPHLLIELLDEVRARTARVDSDDSRRARWRLAKLYATCATADHDLLETALTHGGIFAAQTHARPTASPITLNG